MFKSFLLGIALALTLVAESQENFETSIKSSEFDKAMRLLPDAQIFKVLIWREKRNNRLSLAALTSNAGGWQINVLSPRSLNAYRLSWRSARLTGSFAVSSPNNFQTYELASEEALAFSGCAQHMCPDIFSNVLYVSSQRRAFMGTCADGKTTYSFRQDSRTAEYKTALNELLSKHTGHQNACSSEASQQGK